MSRVELAFVPLEHLHRYRYVSAFLKDKRVLDLAAREGYGTGLLAETAQSVVGLDADEMAVQRAAARQKRANLQFLVGSALNIPTTEDHSFDAIVCFDAIDPSADLDRLLVEVKRVLSPGGLFIVSAPNEASKENLFRTKAFTPAELREFLRSRFQHFQLFRQAIYANSLIQPEPARSNDSGQGTEPQYLLALASDSPVSTLEGSSYVDGLITLLREKERALRSLLDMKVYQDETLKRQERQLAERNRTIATLEEAFAWHTSKIEALEKTRAYLESEIEQLRQSLESQRQALDWRKSQVEDLERASAAQDGALAWRASQLEYLEEQIRQLNEIKRQLDERADAMESPLNELRRALADANNALDAVHASTGWRLVLRIRAMRNRLMPQGSLRYRLYNRLMRVFR
jgi:O-antigen biosynthesis protein